MIKTWADRVLDNDVKGTTVAMLAEIDELRAELAKIKSPSAQPVPDGMVLVPITLTEPMLEKLAYMGRSRIVSGPNKSDWGPAAIRHWKAMLEAAKP